jgi:metallo-beta-lactamase family protein
MKIKFCGATRGVTGSCHLLTTENHKILLDCGQFQGGKAEDEMNKEPFPFDPQEIECVVLSHAHVDHCGRLPLLVKRGFRGDIYCTDATADLLGIMLRDCAYIQQKDCEYQNRKNERAGRPLVKPLYTIDDVEVTLKMVRPVLYDQLIKLNDEMRIVFNDAGHILGSAIIELWVTEGESESKIVFSGDLGMPNRPILRDPTIIKKADCVIMETTYGDRLHPDHKLDVENLVKIIVETARRGGTTVIPSFAVGRTQELIYELNKYFDSHTEYDDVLSDLPVYIDSPMATNTTEIFRKNAQVFDKETREYIMKGDDPLNFKGLHFTRSTEESIALNNDNRPKVVISASGMCEAGRVRHHLKHTLWDARNSVIFVGYQASGTLGRALLGGAKDVTLFGEDIHVKAQIHDLQGFSGHADQNGLLHWVEGFEQRPKQIFLVHGEEDAKKTFAKLLEDKLGYDPVAVMGNSEYEIDTDKMSLLNFEEAAQEAADDEEVQRVRRQLSDIRESLAGVIGNAELRMDSSISRKKLLEINNIVQELDKDAMSLGAVAASQDDESSGASDSEDQTEA